MKISHIGESEEVIIVGINGSPHIKNKLSEMGLIPNQKVKIISNTGRGPIILFVKDSRIAIGRGIAEHIEVSRYVEKEEKEGKAITVAIAGNPNSGKTTIFNNLTGARQHVGNYPGVTVEKKEGYFEYNGYKIKVVDLPGTYSLSAYSLDEVVARDFIINSSPDVVLNVVDSSNLERNLYLTIQLLELEIPVILDLNMIDVSEKFGYVINSKRLEEFLGIKVVKTVGNKNKGIQDIMNAILEVKNSPSKRKFYLNYGKEIEEEIEKVMTLLKEEGATFSYPLRWLAIKLIEGDHKITVLFKNHKKIIQTVQKSQKHLESIFNDDPPIILADRRYGFISGALKEVVQHTSEIHLKFSDNIDKILLNRVIGLPIFFLLMWLMFRFVFYASEPAVEFIEKMLNYLTQFSHILLKDVPLLDKFISEAVIGGVGAVLVFVPVIFTLFFSIALLEDTGYMARAAFLMDKFMHHMGLHGKSFIPMILGFGCNVPAIMATRTIENHEDRMVTILVNPLMSCSARLPVYTLLISAFFPTEWAGNLLFGIYACGIFLAVILSKIFKKTLFSGKTTPFVMELPPYRIPTLKGLLLHMWERGSQYLKKAGTIIFIGAVIIWFLTTFPSIDKPKEEQLTSSYAASIGKIIEPVIKPLGFDWKIGIALIGGVAAKEIIVSTLGIIYQNEKGLVEGLRKNFSSKNARAIALSLMVFILIYCPCFGTIAVIKKETGEWRWAIFSMGYLTVIAWIISFIVYKISSIIFL